MAASALHDARSLESLRAETKLFRERLSSAGVMGAKRPLRISASLSIKADGELRPLSAGGKRVHFVRHGQGFHNLLSDMYREMGKTFDAQSGAGGSQNPYCRPEVLDSPLTEIGRQQARALRPAVQGLAPGLVVTSTLTRATQTALIAFAHLTEDGTKTKVPFLAHDGCHEIGGVHTCDRRRCLAELRREFPQVDYSWTDLPEEDPFWSESEREPLARLAERGYQFMRWLRDRPEDEVVVVAHFAWLLALLNAVVECGDAELSSAFQTGELRSLVLHFEECNGADDGVSAAPSKRQKVD